ncbi:MAG: DNA methyltransferase [Chloroflexota bacterium]
MERLTTPGDVVLDPFLGCGTTAVAAIELNRHFIGCDVDQSAIIATRHRLTEGHSL